MATTIRMVCRLDWSFDFLDLGCFQRWTSEEVAVLPNDVPPGAPSFYRSPEGRWFVDVGGLCYETRPLELTRKFIDDQMLDMPDELRDDAVKALAAESGTPRPSPTAPPIEIGEDGSVCVVNSQLGRLSESRLHVLRPVVEAYPDGLTEDELIDASGHEGAVSIFKGMRERYRPLELALLCPMRRGRGGYRSEWPGGWRA